MLKYLDIFTRYSQITIKNKHENDLSKIKLNSLRNNIINTHGSHDTYKWQINIIKSQEIYKIIH